MSLWESGRGWSSLGLTTLYLPTVMELLFISSETHLVWPDCRSNRRDSDVYDRNPTTKINTASRNSTIAILKKLTLGSRKQEGRGREREDSFFIIGEKSKFRGKAENSRRGSRLARKSYANQTSFHKLMASPAKYKFDTWLSVIRLNT